jgi:hypothetical protein
MLSHIAAPAAKPLDHRIVPFPAACMACPPNADSFADHFLFSVFPEFPSAFSGTFVIGPKSTHQGLELRRVRQIDL